MFYSQWLQKVLLFLFRYEEALVIAKKANQLLRGKKLKSPNRFER